MQILTVGSADFIGSRSSRQLSKKGLKQHEYS